MARKGTVLSVQDLLDLIQKECSTYPSDRDLHALNRKFTAAQRQGKPTNGIGQQIIERLCILKNGKPI